MHNNLIERWSQNCIKISNLTCVPYISCVMGVAYNACDACGGCVTVIYAGIAYVKAAACCSLASASCTSQNLSHRLPTRKRDAIWLHEANNSATPWPLWLIAWLTAKLQMWAWHGSQSHPNSLSTAFLTLPPWSVVMEGDASYGMPYLQG